MVGVEERVGVRCQVILPPRGYPQSRPARAHGAIRPSSLVEPSFGRSPLQRQGYPAPHAGTARCITRPPRW